ncbi:unnamed protein product [Cuscuta europaea]|uniref:glutathione transferase n=1 Tax=Cuscuta europaea TaxID=41803 RepID=A0A9P1E5A7_CUSEU|nr:unnamed protein product [Cuscuta europaea]
MAPKVHGTLQSPATLRVIACLKEKELDYELILVNMKGGEHKKEPFLRLNPFGKVPVFEDGDLKLFESRAITRYIAHTYVDHGSKLIPTNYKEKAIMWVWMEVEAHQFDVVASKLVFELIIKPLLGTVTDNAIVAQHEEALSKVLDVYEQRLKVSEYMAGEYFTLVDLHHTPVISQLMGTKAQVFFKARPRVDAWVAKLLARPAWLEVQKLVLSNNTPASSNNTPASSISSFISSPFLLCFECSIFIVIICAMLHSVFEHV